LSLEIKIEKTIIGEKSNSAYLNSQPKPHNMKKAVIGSLVGALIIFIWQFVSFALADLHKSAHRYTDKQDAIMSFLSSQGLKEGGYMLPNVPEGTDWNDRDKAMKNAAGKPWAMIQYHEKMEEGMTMNMIRGFLVNFVTVLLFCWLVSKMTAPGFETILISALMVGIIAFLYEPYTGSIWYKWADIWAFFIDAIVAWGLTGLWLGWWLRRGRPQLSTVKIGEAEKELA
jgi:hypothetical protein